MDERITRIMQRVRRIEVKTKMLSDNIFAGEYHSAFKGRGMSFSEVREYQDGDDIRDIDWNVTARFDRAYVKVYEEERELTMMLLVDVSGSLDFGTQGQTQRELLTEIAATIAFSAMRNGDKIGIVCFSDRIERFIPPAKGKAHVLRIIRELLTIEPQSRRTNIGFALDSFMKMVRRSCVAFLLSDFLDTSDYSRQLAVARRRHDLVAVQLYDRRMAELPKVGLVKLEDAETGHLQYVDTSSERVRRLFAQHWQQRNTELLHLFRRCNIDHTAISTTDDFVKGLRALFAQRR